MIFSDRKIKELLGQRKIEVFPQCLPKDIRPVGIRLHLAKELLVPVSGQTVDILDSREIEYESVKIADFYKLKPGEFVLGSTIESIRLDPGIVGKLDGRSTIARLGLLVHCSSDIVDGNHDQARSIVLELKNVGNFDLKLRVGIPIAMIAFYQLVGTIEQESQSQYQNQTGVAPPNLTSQLQ